MPRLRREPLWTGPAGKGEKGGVTQSMIANFLADRERFRLQVIEGLNPLNHFDHKLEFGHFWHIAEAAFGEGLPAPGQDMPSADGWCHYVRQYAEKLCTDYPFDRDKVDHWYQVTMVAFPEWIKYQLANPPPYEAQCLVREKVFDVPYELPSKRRVRLRGKWDGVDILGEGKHRRLYLQEHKTKGKVDTNRIGRQLRHDLQLGFYLTALEEGQKASKIGSKVNVLGEPIGPLPLVGGAIYNVVLRPLSGGKGNIRRRKPTKKNPAGESKESFYGRLRKIIGTTPGEFFFRFKVEMLPDDIRRFRRETLDPILEEMFNWYEWVSVAPDPFCFGASEYQGYHWRQPYNLWNPVDEGMATEYDDFLESGIESGLVRSGKLFEELAC